MSSIVPGVLRPIADWADVADWLASCFGSLDVGDVFDVGPASLTVYDSAQHVACAQARALGGGLIWLGLSAFPQWAEPIFDLEGQNTEISADHTALANKCVAWFRDEHRLHFTHLGCELTPSAATSGDADIGA